MPRKALENLTESMFYVLMALENGSKCGTDIADFIENRTQKRIQMGPATLYTILGKFVKVKYIEETEVDGRKRTYRITKNGAQAYVDEVIRLKHCILDSEYEDNHGSEGTKR